jgi:hypothetical protein
MPRQDQVPTPDQRDRIREALDRAHLTRLESQRQLRRSQHLVRRAAALADQLRPGVARPAPAPGSTARGSVLDTPAAPLSDPPITEPEVTRPATAPTSPEAAIPAPRLDVYRDGTLAATFVYGQDPVYYGASGQEVRSLVERPHESYNPWRDEIGDGARHPHDPTWWMANVTGAGLGRAGFEICATDPPEDAPRPTSPHPVRGSPAPDD